MRKSALAIFLSSFVTVVTTVTEAQLPAEPLVHYDAAQQGQARSAGNLATIGSGQALDFLLDGSKGKHRATQPVPERRPIYVSDGASAYLKFDGKDDFLALQ